MTQRTESQAAGRPSGPPGHRYTALHQHLDDSSTQAAAVIVPLVMDLFEPTSVIDIGCGRGWFLAAFKQAGVARVLGIDGDYVTPAELYIDPTEFEAQDLSRTCAVSDEFDVAVSLEVAEHLPPAAGDALINVLVASAPVVVFSAAVPGQGGVHHVNEQWPSYWATRFEAHGYRPTDPIRPAIWVDDRVPWYYRQNIVVYLKRGVAALDQIEDAAALDLVHPTHYLSKLSRLAKLQAVVDRSLRRRSRAALRSGRDWLVQHRNRREP
jgi:SAM-dependent methyltransferase